ncbi:glycosyl hydrolase family 18 protein [Paenibacillus sp. strain BS8-2]
MVYPLARTRMTNPLIWLLCLALLISPFFSPTTIQADELPIVNPEAPQSLAVDPASITSSSATITWTHDASKNDVDVWHAEPAGGGDGYFTWGNGGSRNITGLSPGTTYKLYITWDLPVGISEHRSNIIEFTTLEGEDEPDPTGGPTNLVVESVTHNSVSLTWTPAPGIAHYWIWDSSNKYILWANDGAQTVGGLTPETTYSFYVGPDGVQAPNLTPEQKSNLVTFTTLPDTSVYEEAPLSPPHNFKVDGISGTDVTFSWTGSPGAADYDLYVNGDSPWTGTVTGATYSIPEALLDSGIPISFNVVAKDSANERVSASSNTVAFTWGELAAPADVQVVTANRSTIVLGWAPVPGATAYTVYRDGTAIGTTADPRLTISDLTAGQSYAFTVKASNELWESPASHAATGVPGANYTNVTYYTSWSLSEEGRNFKPEDIDVSQLTHINYAFADLCWKKFGSGAAGCHNKDLPLQDDYVYDGEVIIGDADFDPRNFESFATIKESNPHLKLLVSVGGWSWSNNFSHVAASEVTRRAMANSAVDFMREYGLDGLDIDWEYPIEGGEEGNAHSPEDTVNFTLLMKTIREAFDAAGSEDGKYYLLTIASGQGDNFVANADLAHSSAYLDFINIMAYDYSGSWELFAHHNSPLYYDAAHPKDYAARNNVSGGAVGHLNGGVPPHKLVLGIPFYGKGWLGCSDGGEYGTCTSIPAGTWEAGVFDVADLENNFVGKDGYVKHWNEASKTAYLWNEETGMFITYNDETSMKYSASFVKSLNLAGVMSWEVSGDRNLTLQDQLALDLPIDGAFNPETLAAPTQLRLTSIGTTHATLEWAAVPDADAYEVYANRKYLGTTTDTTYYEQQLQPSTSYSFYVLAITRDGDVIDEVSPASIVNAATDAVFPYLPTVKDKDELDATVMWQSGKLTISVNEIAALGTIKVNDSAAFTLTADPFADSLDIQLSDAVAAALAAKGEDAQLSIVWGDVTYIIPAAALARGTDIRISIRPPSEEAEAIDAEADEAGLTLLTEPLDFQIAEQQEDGSYAEITDFEGQLFHRVFTLSGDDAKNSRLIGVIYLPASGEFRPVATVIREQTDGTVTAELIRDGNSIYAVAATTFDYEDIAIDWAQDAIELATSSLLVSGKSAAEFGSSDNISRAEFISLVTRMLGILPDYGSSVFADVDADTAFAGDITAAAKLGLVTGKTVDHFDPNGSISRQDMAIVLTRALALVGRTNETDVTILDHFNDYIAVGSYARESVAWLVELGILKGVSASVLSPLTNVTKAQATVAVIRLMDSLQEG